MVYFLLSSVWWGILPYWSSILWAPGSFTLYHWLPLSSLQGLTEWEMGEGESSRLSQW